MSALNERDITRIKASGLRQLFLCDASFRAESCYDPANNGLQIDIIRKVQEMNSSDPTPILPLTIVWEMPCHLRTQGLRHAANLLDEMKRRALRLFKENSSVAR
jgi:hypothetical protein